MSNDYVMVPRSLLDRVYVWSSPESIVGKVLRRDVQAALDAPAPPDTANAPEPVAAQQRFRHPQKSMPDWSAWQHCAVSNRPSWCVDLQGYEVEYRPLYTAPPDTDALRAEVERLKEYEPAVHEAHQGYNPRCPVDRPESPKQAIAELIEEAVDLAERECDHMRASESRQLAALRAKLAALADDMAPHVSEDFRFAISEARAKGWHDKLRALLEPPK